MEYATLRFELDSTQGRYCFAAGSAEATRSRPLAAAGYNTYMGYQFKPAVLTAILPLLYVAMTSASAATSPSSAASRLSSGSLPSNNRTSPVIKGSYRVISNIAGVPPVMSTGGSPSSKKLLANSSILAGTSISGAQSTGLVTLSGQTAVPSQQVTTVSTNPVSPGTASSTTSFYYGPNWCSYTTMFYDANGKLIGLSMGSSITAPNGNLHPTSSSTAMGIGQGSITALPPLPNTTISNIISTVCTAHVFPPSGTAVNHAASFSDLTVAALIKSTGGSITANPFASSLSSLFSRSTDTRPSLSLGTNQPTNNDGGLILTGVNGTNDLFKQVAEPLEDMIVDTGESEP